MSITAIVKALIDSGATSEMILAAVSADEKSRLERIAIDRESARKRKIKSRNINNHVTVTPVTSVTTPLDGSDGFNGFPNPSLTSLSSLNPTKENPPKGGQKKNPQQEIILPSWMPLDAWEGFREMRIKIKKPMTERAERMAIGKLEKFRAMGHDPTEILNQSTFSDYQDLYEPKEKSHASTSRNNAKSFGNSGESGAIGKSKWTSAAEQIIAEDRAARANQSG